MVRRVRSRRRPLEALPLSRIFRDDGLVIARSGWGWDAPGKPVRRHVGHVSVAAPYYGDHAHYDNNHFDIYYKGELAIDSGRYDDDWGMEQTPDIIKSEFFNYYQRTIAHNTILVYDPDEKMEMGVVNDGGQLELMRVGGIRNVPEDYDQGNYPHRRRAAGACDWATNPGRWDTGKMLAYKGTRSLHIRLRRRDKVVYAERR